MRPPRGDDRCLRSDFDREIVCLEMQSSYNLIGRVSSYLEDVHVVFQLLQLLHPLLDDILDFRLSDHQDFLPRQHDNKEFSDHEFMAGLLHSLRLTLGLVPLPEINPLERSQ